MRQNRAVISFEKEFLNNLVQDESACVELREQDYHLALHPFHLNNVKGSVQDILNEGISKYDKKLGGILLGYQDIKLRSSGGTISNDSFFIHVDVAAAFYLFKPEAGKVLTGNVNKKSKDHVGCLVHKTFNVSLPKPEHDDDDWMGSKVQIGQDILFRITFTNLEGRLPYIRAEFMSILSEQDSGISTSEENVEMKPKKIKFDCNSDEEVEIAQTKKHKKKKRKHKDSVVETHEPASDIEKDTNTRKKHKHKNRSHEEDLELGANKKKKSKHKHRDSILANNEGASTSSKHKHRNASYEEEPLELESVKKKKKSKHKHSVSEMLEVDSGSTNKNEASIEADNSPKDLQKKKHKHRRSFEELDKDKREKAKHGQNDSSETLRHAEEYEIQDGLKNKKHKHKRKSKHSISFEDAEAEEEKSAKKSKKSKHKDTLQELQDSVLQQALRSFSEPSTSRKQKKSKKHKSERRHSQSDPDISLPELNLSSLFNENVGMEPKPRGHFLMADNEDKAVKRLSSTSHTTLYEDKALQLPPDSDLENILLDVGKKHKRKSHEGAVRKRRRSTSSDDFKTPKFKKQRH